MAEFRKSGGFGGGNRGGFRKDGGRGGFRGKPDFKHGGGFDSFNKEMFSATCATCNKQCEVPFRPNGEKPVYCRDCFRNVQGKPESNFNNRDDRGDRNRGEGRFPKPQATAPATFVQNRDTRIDDIKNYAQEISSKLDLLMQIMTPKTLVLPVPEITPKPAAKKKAAPKTSKKK